MSTFAYIDRAFSNSSLRTLAEAAAILDEFAGKGYILTLRQLFYQFVARGLIENTQRSYKRLGSLVSDGRLAGVLDWEFLEDRTRKLERLAHWQSPQDILQAAAQSYRLDRWAAQDYYIEVWIEKDALAGVVERVCNELDAPWLSTRGYISQSEMHSAACRLRKKIEAGKQAVVVHLSDHDPSGVDMTRDIRERFRLFLAPFLIEEEDPAVIRLALTIEQVGEFALPPNPTKVTDSRAEAYINRFGNDSWELDALDPTVLHNLIHGEISSYITSKSFHTTKQREEREAGELRAVTSRWNDVRIFLRSNES